MVAAIRWRKRTWANVILSGAEVAGTLSRPPAIRSLIDVVLNNPDLEIADVVDMAMKNIAAVDCANSGRRP